MGKPVIKGDTIKVPSDPEFLPDVDLFLEGTLRGFGAEESVVADIAISVSELVNNAMLHGNESADDKVVTVTINRGKGAVTVTIESSDTGDFSGEEQTLDAKTYTAENKNDVFPFSSYFKFMRVTTSTQSNSTVNAKLTGRS